jgi:phosphoglycerol transferase MdoB-like AlkP superfamily enzyme
MKEIMQEADGMDRPFFFFAVTLQGHGPYEANRYANNSIDIKGNLTDADRATLATYTQGVKEADESFKMLVDWASRSASAKPSSCSGATICRRLAMSTWIPATCRIRWPPARHPSAS